MKLILNGIAFDQKTNPPKGLKYDQWAKRVRESLESSHKEKEAFDLNVWFDKLPRGWFVIAIDGDLYHVHKEWDRLTPYLVLSSGKTDLRNFKFIDGRVNAELRGEFHPISVYVYAREL